MHLTRRSGAADTILEELRCSGLMLYSVPFHTKKSRVHSQAGNWDL